MEHNQHDQTIVKAELIEAFKIFDIHNKGYISEQELKYCLEKMGE